MSDILSSPIADLDLPHKAVMGLLDAGIETIGDMAALCRKDLDKVPGVGNVTIRKLDAWLATHKAQIEALPAPTEEEIETFVGESQFVEAEPDADLEEAIPELKLTEEEAAQADEIAAYLQALDVALPDEVEELEEAEELTSEGLGEKELAYLALPLSDPYSRLPHLPGFVKGDLTHVIDLVLCSAENLKEHFSARELMGIARRFALHGVSLEMKLSSETMEKILNQIA